jgi:DNA repair exonuclease SbcCD ATPase subunit
MLKELHDRLMEQKPEGASHNESDCPFCGSAVPNTEAEEVSVSYTEEQLKAKVDEAVASATKDLEAKVKELEEVRSASEVEAKLAEAKAEAETKISEIQAQLDTAVLEAEKAKTEKEEILAFLEAESKKAEEQAALVARRDERLKQVAEVASFPEEYAEANADRWAALDEEQFAALLEDYKAAGAKKEGLPATTALTASRETDKGSVLKEVLGLRFKGIDPRML